MKRLKNTKDLIMLLLYSSGESDKDNEPISGQTRLMKMIFLFGKELKKQFLKDEELNEAVFPEFQAYDYGPFSRQVYADLEWLVNMGFIEAYDSKSSKIFEEERGEFDYWSATGTDDDDVVLLFDAS